MKNKKRVFQSTIRVYQEKHSRLYHLFEQLDSSQGELVVMLAEQAIKMGNLEDIHPREILNGTCYTLPVTTQSSSAITHSTQTDSRVTEKNNSSQSHVDAELGASAVEFMS